MIKPVKYEIKELERALDRVMELHVKALQDFEELDAELNRLTKMLEEAESYKNDLLHQMYRIEDKLAEKRKEANRNERAIA